MEYYSAYLHITQEHPYRSGPDKDSRIIWTRAWPNSWIFSTPTSWTAIGSTIPCSFPVETKPVGYKSFSMGSTGRAVFVCSHQNSLKLHVTNIFHSKLRSKT